MEVESEEMTAGYEPEMERSKEEEARRIMAAGLGRAELEFATSICAPLYWIIPEGTGRTRVRNGTAYFLDTGSGPFGVTAAHVLAGLEADHGRTSIESIQLGHDLALDFEVRHAIIDSDADLDIATFRISQEEIAALQKQVLTGSQSAWPPSPPRESAGIYFSGFPEGETIWLSSDELSFGAAPGAGIADSVSDCDVCTLFDRSRWIDVMGLGLPLERFDFSGMSGGPMLAVIERNGIRTWTLAGTIYQGPCPTGELIPGFEVMRARRADFILEGGRLNLEEWHSIRGT